MADRRSVRSWVVGLMMAGVMTLGLFPFASEGNAQGSQCGNGIIEGNEECDSGAGNNDSAKNACRSNCRRPSCGDSVTDSGEQCDAGPANHDQIPNACRSNCKRAHCGDTVLDGNEECDDGNNDAYDGCHACKLCVKPKSGLVVTKDTKLCSGRYSLRQPISVRGNSLTLDCNRTTLRGVGKHGPGIVVTGNNVVVRNCNLSDFSVGLDLRGRDAVVFDNWSCNNKVDIKSRSGNFGTKNACRTPEGWSDAGSTGCRSACAGAAAAAPRPAKLPK